MCKNRWTIPNATDFILKQGGEFVKINNKEEFKKESRDSKGRVKRPVEFTAIFKTVEVVFPINATLGIKTLSAVDFLLKKYPDLKFEAKNYARQ